jgi:hypothetical protein
VTLLARLVAPTALLTRATADALDTMARSLVVQQQRCPDVLPEFVDDGTAEW